MARKSFFKLLKELRTIILVENQKPITKEPYSIFTVESFKYLDDFITKSSWTKSKSVNFICRNKYMTDDELVYLWKLKFNEDKSASTFRVQKRNISDTLEQIIGSVSTVETAFLSDNETLITNIINQVRVLSINDYSVSDILDHSFVVSILDDVELGDDTSINLTMCSNEIEFIRRFSSTSRDFYLKKLNKQKLRYLFKVLQTPIISKGKISREKIDLINQLGGMSDTGNAPNFSALEFINSLSASSPSDGVSSSSEVEDLSESLSLLSAENEKLKEVETELRGIYNALFSRYTELETRLNQVEKERDLLLSNQIHSDFESISSSSEPISSAIDDILSYGNESLVDSDSIHSESNLIQALSDKIQFYSDVILPENIISTILNADDVELINDADSAKAIVRTVVALALQSVLVSNANIEQQSGIGLSYLKGTINDLSDPNSGVSNDGKYGLDYLSALRKIEDFLLNNFSDNTSVISKKMKELNDLIYSEFKSSLSN